MIGRFALTSLTAATLAAALAGGVAAVPALAQAGTATATSFGDAPGVVRLPEAVAVAPGGDVLVGDHFSGRVQRFHDGRYVGSFGLRGEGCGRLGAIGGLARGRPGQTHPFGSPPPLPPV